MVKVAYGLVVSTRLGFALRCISHYRWLFCIAVLHLRESAMSSL